MAKRTAKRSVKPQNRLKIKKRRNPNPPPPPKEHQFKPGQSGNPGGRPKRVTDAYREWLETVDEQAGDFTNAQLLARSMGIESLKGNVSAAGEIRKATEGERIRTWRDDVIDLIREGKVTPDQVSQDLGDELATELSLAAGIHRGKSGETHQTNTTG